MLKITKLSSTTFLQTEIFYSNQQLNICRKENHATHIHKIDEIVKKLIYKKTKRKKKMNIAMNKK